jgi:hypothetical protein
MRTEARGRRYEDFGDGAAGSNRGEAESSLAFESTAQFLEISSKNMTLPFD